MTSKAIAVGGSFLHLSSTKSWRGYIFTAVCLSVCLCVCVCLSLCLSVSKQNSSRMDTLIWTRFSLNGCLPQWLKPYWNWWHWIKGRGHSDNISIFLHNSHLTFLHCISALLRPIVMKFIMSLTHVLGWFVFEFHKNRIVDDVIVTSFDFHPNNRPYLNFYWTYKLRTWNHYTTT